jgi:hypothetical protein
MMNIRELKERYPRAFDATYATWCEGEGNPDSGWSDSVIAQAVEDAAERGFEIQERRGRKEPAFYFSGFWSQGDGASWEGVVDVPKWIEWMKAEVIRKLDLGPPIRDLGNGTPFDDQQLLWIGEAYRNDYLEANVQIYVPGNGCHSAGMRVRSSLDVQVNYDQEVQEGIFKGMDTDTFTHTFYKMFDGAAVIEQAALEAARDFADNWYDVLEGEFEYLTSEEYFIEYMAGMELDEHGNEQEVSGA